MDRPPDFWGPREKAEEARSLLGSPIFGVACGDYRRALMDKMLTLTPGDPAVTMLHIELKMIDQVIGQLQHYVNEAQFRKVA